MSLMKSQVKVVVMIALGVFLGLVLFCGGAMFASDWYYRTHPN